MYLAKAAGVNPDFDCLEWWERRLPNWSRAVLKVLLVQPSSAGAEIGLGMPKASCIML